MGKAPHHPAWMGFSALPALTMLPIVSIIIPTRNAAHTLPQCLQSIAALEYPSEQIETIIIDGDSHDTTVAIALAARATVLKGCADGPTAARLLALPIARGKIVAFTDADCVVSKNWLKNAVRHLERGEADVIGGPLEAPKQNVIAQVVKAIFKFSVWIGISEHHEFIAEGQRAVTIPTSNFIAYRESILHDSAGMNWQGYGGDIVLNKRMRNAGKRLALFSDVSVAHYKRATLRGFAKQMFQWGSGRARAGTSNAAHAIVGFSLPIILLVDMILFLEGWRDIPSITFTSALTLMLIMSVWTGVFLRSLAAAFYSPFVVGAGYLGWSTGYVVGWVQSIAASSTDTIQGNGTARHNPA